MATDRRTVIGGALAMTLAGPVAAATPEPVVLRRGISLWPWFSLTREYPAPRTDYAWPPFQPDRPVPNAGDLRHLAEAGFDFVRLPIDPGPFAAFAGAQRERLFAMLSEAVDLILASRLSLVLNVQANAATHYYNPDRFYGTATAPLLPAYRDVVVELARRFGGRAPGRIALEPVNEPPQACGAVAWNRVQAALLGAARKAAPAMTLVATGACGGMGSGLTALDPASFAALAPVLFTFHFYEPYLFSHQGAPWMKDEPIYRALNDVPWPARAGTLDATLAAVRARMRADTATSDADKAAAYAVTETKMKEYFAAAPDRGYLDRNFADIRTWADLYGVAPRRILMGEFGALRSDARYVASRAPDRARYIRDVREAAEAAGFAWAFWNLFDGLGLMDDAHRIDPAIIAALGLTMPGTARR
ncbi:glycoside hydrolase family 5 protein [Methylobacterium sp. E-016]|uniref:glycoside hydrolase family 5 protein n=1 Tax=Methylobacterium sp. E-016 TaxID=2836556 RepID=UPI001FBA2B79|nr:cellulase family glycosylhydrolase [Methylobacterium sp. E-016]MCJ2074635.1 glycoside hydrolase family 5 protein [Methylobacterium sp. E-016]